MRVTATTRIACPPDRVFDTLVTIAYTLTPTADATDLESDFDFRPTRALKLLFSLLAPVIRRDVPKQYASLKALCEGALS